MRSRLVSRGGVAAVALALVVLAVVGWRATRTSESPGLSFDADAPGAAALLDPANADVRWSDVDSVESIAPLPADAVDDRPPSYDPVRGCQVKSGDPVPAVCAFGDTAATRTVMLVGDSKIAQWESAFAGIGRREHWRLLTRTKSACSFADASITGGNRVLTDCRQWGRATLAAILREKPEVVVTSQLQDEALPEGKTDGRDATRDAMALGLRRYWTQLQAAGIQVVVLLNNPIPTTHPVYQCVEDHPLSLRRCAYAFDLPLSRSSAPTQRQAAKATPGVSVMDMAPVYCPGEAMCPAVIGNVLVYRAGSHLTDTFVASAQAQVAAQLAKATNGRFGAG